jgi:hypothetical protein
MWEVPVPSLVISYRFGVGRGVEAITGVGAISSDAVSDPDILPSPMAGFMEGVIGKGGSQGA